MNNEDLDLKIKILINLLQSLTREKFWGQLTIKFKNGEPLIVHQERQIKI